MSKKKKQKSVEVIRPIQYLTLHKSAHCHVTREGNPDDPYDNDCTSTNWEVHGVSLNVSRPHFGETFEVPENKYTVGEDIFVLYAIYSTGDSFSSHDCAELELVGFFKNETLAYDNLRILEQHTKEVKDPKRKKELSWSVDLKSDNGDTWNFHVPWLGYFESLDYLKVEKFEIVERYSGFEY